MTETQIPMFFAGARQQAHSARTSPVYNPSSGQIAARLPLGDATDIEAIIADATAAFPAWGRKSALSRAHIMFKWRELCISHADELALLISNEHGKVVSDARGELQRGIEVIEFAAGIPHLMKGEFSDQVSRSVDMHSLRQPLGVVAAITPFNFPAMVPLWMLGPALACGNTVVLKPSERDPSVSVRLAELFIEAGGPPGVLNVLHGDAEAVNALCSDPRIQAVSFVGSTPIARHVYETAARHGKRVQSMGGAKNHLVVLPDADLDMTVSGLMGAAYGSAGERCMAISVAVAVGNDTAEALVARLVERIKTLKVGPSTADGMDMGPVVTGAHRDRISGYIDLGVKEGATLVVDGRKHPAQESGGFFLGATLFDHVTKDMTIYKDEIFGPVLCVVRVDTADEALELCDKNQFGNGVSIFTRSGGAAREFASRVQCGMVGVNIPIPVPLSFYTFGGWKDSAFGALNQYGMDGIMFYTKLKTVTTRWPQEEADSVSFSMPVLH